MEEAIVNIKIEAEDILQEIESLSVEMGQSELIQNPNDSGSSIFPPSYFGNEIKMEDIDDMLFSAFAGIKREEEDSFEFDGLQETLINTLVEIKSEVNMDDAKEEHRVPDLNKIETHQEFLSANEVVSVSGERFQCDKCSYTCKSHNSLSKHYKTKHKNKILKCVKCMYKTKFIWMLRKHNEIAHMQEKKPFHCDQCRFRTNQEKNLKAHILKVHNPFAPVCWYHCSYCDFQTKRKNSLKHHTLVKHISTEQLFYCPHCPYVAKVEFNLKRHMALHKVAVEKYKCEFCPYEANIKATLLTHKLRKHKGRENGENYDCKQCSYTTQDRANLKSHIYNVHMPVNETKILLCEHCGYLAKRSSTFNHHMLVKHLLANEKFLKCSFCSYGTNVWLNLKRHIISNHGRSNLIKNSFKCEHCSYQADLKATLYKHVNRKHPQGKLKSIKLE